MKSTIVALLTHAVQTLQAQNEIPADLQPNIQVENTRDRSHGDWASNLALMLAKPCHCAPRALAEKLVAALPADRLVARVHIAGPGFINFFLSEASQTQQLTELFAQGSQYGQQNLGQGARIQVEFVSANPTGPLHVGHGRGAAYGATVADLLTAVGYQVDREYYLNDDGRQMDILTTSVFLRYLELCGETFTFPSNGYRGDYIFDIAQTIFTDYGRAYHTDGAALLAQAPLDEPQGGDREQHIDGLIQASQTALGTAGYAFFHHTALTDIRNDIEQDLREFGIEYQCWFSERSLATGESQVAAALAALTAAGHTEWRDGALWFLSTRFGDDKDRVLCRENGQTTYFASDIAYHQNKFARGYDTLINIWGADHHGYITRVKAAMTALGFDAERLIIPMVQFANLYRGGEKLAMSTRSGSFVTFRALRAEVGNDAARFIYVTRKVDQPMDFDLELAKSQSKDNPVYYVQYAHARVCSMIQKLATDGIAFDAAQGLAAVTLLQEPAEQDLLNRISQYPDVLRRAALAYEPHLLANYLRELAGVFHAWYNATRVLVDHAELRAARVTLALAVRQIIANALHLLGVSAPQSM